MTSGILSIQVKLPVIKITKQQSALNFKSLSLSFFSFGNQSMVSSFLWLATMIESDIDHYKAKDGNSWMFSRFDVITDLNPWFYNAYRIGGIYLSVIKDDDIGAKTLLEKGLIRYPDDLRLNYFYGFHCFIELLDYSCALKSFEKVLLIPEGRRLYSAFLPSIVAKLKTKDLPKEQAFALIDGMKKEYVNDPLVLERLETILKKINNGEKHFK